MNWFLIRVQQGRDTSVYAGSSPHSLEALAEQASQGRYIRLDNLALPNDGGVNGGAEWPKNAIPTMVINPSAIVTIMQLTGDPRSNKNT